MTDVRGQAHAPRGGLGELGHAGRVLAKPRRLEIGERGDRREGGVDPFARDPDLRERLELQRLLPHPRVVELGEDLVEVAPGELGEPRLVRRARPALDDRACLLRAGGGEEDRDVSRHVQEPHRQRDRVAAGDPGNPSPSQRSKTCSSAAWVPELKPSHPAKRCATSQCIASV